MPTGAEKVFLASSRDNAYKLDTHGAICFLSLFSSFGMLCFCEKWQCVKCVVVVSTKIYKNEQSLGAKQLYLQYFIVLKLLLCYVV